MNKGAEQGPRRSEIPPGWKEVEQPKKLNTIYPQNTEGLRPPHFIKQGEREFMDSNGTMRIIQKIEPTN